VLTAAVGHFLYQAPWPAHPLPALVTVLLAGIVFCVIGLAITAVTPNADAAPAVVNFASLPILFISGFFFNFNNAVFADIAKVFPIYWFKEAMLTSFGAEHSSSGWNGEDLLVMLIWGVVGVAVTLRFFRWESRRA
jgi:ABC-2 type transport system permease protein